MRSGEALLWQLYDQITAQVLLAAGGESDLLSAATAQAMGTSVDTGALAVLEGGACAHAGRSRTR
jgi:hypothetical protein